MKIPAKPKRWLKPFFILKKAEQRGIIVLSLLVLILFLFKQLLPFLIAKDEFDDPEFIAEVALFLKQQRQIHDSIRIVELQNRGELDRELAVKKLHPFPVDPNLATKEDWLMMGLTSKQARTILNYLSKGGRFRKKKDLAKIYCISENEYEILKPYLILPSEENKKTAPIPAQTEKATYLPIELNSADSTELVEKLRVKSWLAKRIIKYRELLGGFYQPSQLFEVYGFDSNEVRKRLSQITVDTNSLRKLDINAASFKQLVRHPYISYELTKYIVNTLRQKGRFSSTEMLMESDLITDRQFAKMRPYLTIN